MQTKNKIFSFDVVIFCLLFGLLPVDMLNGFLLKEAGIESVVSISQVYKIILFFFIFIRISSTEKLMFISFFLLMLIPSVFQIFKSGSISLIFNDAIKITKYLGSFLTFLYFRSIFISKSYLLKWIYRWFSFSFLILFINIFLKLFGLGFPMYIMNSLEIGSKGYFYAGNELSGVLLVLCSFLLYWHRLHNNKISFIIIAILSLLTGIYVTSKTAILGTMIIIIWFFIFDPRGKKISIKKIFSYLLVFFTIIPLSLYFIIKYLETSALMQRVSYYWNELDIYTFLLSNRNTFLNDFIKIFKEKYNIIEMILGVGQTTFETLNNNHIIELDFFDIYFAYGFVGVILFISYITFLLIKSYIFSFNKSYSFAQYSKFIATVLIILSFLSGHIFNSGMAAVYIGCVFSLMYYKKNHESKVV